MKKINNTSIVIIFILILIIFILLISNYNKNKPERQACINSYCFEIKIAQTKEERARGLMFRSFLPKNQGMLFIFENEDKHSFWMKNTLIPLDIVWISKDLKIVHIENNVQPCQQEPCKTYTPIQKAIYVLEVNTGLAKEYNFQIGDIVNLKR